MDFLRDPLHLSHTRTINAVADCYNITHTCCHHLKITENQDISLGWCGPSFWQFQLSTLWICSANPQIISRLWFTFAATWSQISMRKLKSSITTLAFKISRCLTLSSKSIWNLYCLVSQSVTHVWKPVDLCRTSGHSTSDRQLKLENDQQTTPSHVELLLSFLGLLERFSWTHRQLDTAVWRAGLQQPQGHGVRLTVRS